MFAPLVQLANAAVEGSTAWHFEQRHAANGKHPTFYEVGKSGSGWRKLSQGESVFHSNKLGKDELKFVHDASGREAVFTRDNVLGGSTDGSYQPYTDPKYMATFNYVTTSRPPSGALGAVVNPKGTARWVGTGAGHLVFDVLPYKMGLGNVRGEN